MCVVLLIMHVNCATTQSCGSWLRLSVLPFGIGYTAHKKEQRERRNVTVTLRAKLQALVYDILPLTNGVFSYVIGSRKLSANEHFFVGAQTVSLLQTTQIISECCCCFLFLFLFFVLFYNSSCCLRQLKSNQNRLTRDGSHFSPGWMRLMFTCVLGR